MPTFRVIDFETTGFPPNAGVVEIGWTDLMIAPEGSRINGPFSVLTNPKMPIEIGAMAVHHITDEQLEGKAHPQEHLNSLHDNADFIVAHNADFEQKFYVPPIPVICSLKVAYRLLPDSPSHSNQVLRYYLGLKQLDPDKCLPAHRAGPDTYVTARIFMHLLQLASKQGIKLSELVQWSNEPSLLPRCPIGKEHRGKKWSEIDSGFLNWMLRQATMETDLKFNARMELKRRGVTI